MYLNNVNMNDSEIDVLRKIISSLSNQLSSILTSNWILKSILEFIIDLNSWLDIGFMTLELTDEFTDALTNELTKENWNSESEFRILTLILNSRNSEFEF